MTQRTQRQPIGSDHAAHLCVHQDLADICLCYGAPTSCLLGAAAGSHMPVQKGTACGNPHGDPTIDAHACLSCKEAFDTTTQLSRNVYVFLSENGVNIKHGIHTAKRLFKV